MKDPIDLRERKQGSISDLLPTMSRFKVYESPLLFETDYSLLKESRCPLCMNKLKIMRDKPYAYCSSKKHRKRFICSISKLST